MFELIVNISCITIMLAVLTFIGYCVGKDIWYDRGYNQGYDNGYDDALEFCDSDEWVEAYKEVRKENN